MATTPIILCARCRQRPARRQGGYCLQCHAAYQREWRRKANDRIARRVNLVLQRAGVADIRLGVTKRGLFHVLHFRNGSKVGAAASRLADQAQPRNPAQD